MYYVVRKGEDINMYHEVVASFEKAKEKAEKYKSLFGHEYDVIKMETVYTTQTLANIIATMER
jgi:hypothetical protein